MRRNWPASALWRAPARFHGRPFVGRCGDPLVSRRAYCPPVTDAVRCAQAMEGRLAVPRWEEFTSTITAMYDAIKATVHGGANASYIPILEEADPNWFGISVCTVDGQRFDIGDTDVDFSIQSCVKPLMYAVAIEDIGLERVHKHVGIEPSGLAFNEVSLNEDGLPHNPMINPGVCPSRSPSPVPPVPSPSPSRPLVMTDVCVWLQAPSRRGRV